jgi:hypothetical protein
MSKLLTILLVSKTGEITESSIKSFDTETLYKKAGFKSGDGFVNQTEWGIEIQDTKYNIELYAKTSGRAGQENKYEFPPPIDTTLFFGTAVLINRTDGIPTSLFQEEWSKIYEALYGGFEDVGEEDSEEGEDEDDDLPKTKEGYAKDGFIVESDESEDDADLSDESEEDVMTDSSEEKPKAKAKAKVNQKNNSVASKVLENTVITKKPTTRSAAAKKKLEKAEPQNNNSYLNCDDELEIEEYA